MSTDPDGSSSGGKALMLSVTLGSLAGESSSPVAAAKKALIICFHQLSWLGLFWAVGIMALIQPME